MPRKPQRINGLVCHGIGVSPGVAVGPVFVLENRMGPIAERQLHERELEQEIGRFEAALIETRGQIKALQKNLAGQGTANEGGFLEAHLMVLDDRSFVEDVIDLVRTRRKNVEAAVHSVAERHAEALGALQDEYLRERVADVRDLARRVVRNLLGDTDHRPAGLARKHILAARDLTPSETASLRKEKVLAFATDLGSATSHTAVMARALEIPAVVAMHDVTARLRAEDKVLVDGNRGILIVNPTRDQLCAYGKLARSRRSVEHGLRKLKGKNAQTRDGWIIKLAANIEGIDELDSVIEHGAEGIGLFRSEYLYLSKGASMSENEQTKAYAEAVRRLAPHPVVIRTLDLGGDKFVVDSKERTEPNPFLGCRSIRLSLRYPDHFKTQLKAMLRASVHGNLRIMYPMISSVGEVIQANRILDEAKKELSAGGVAFKQDIKVGAMIEIPSAVLTASSLAQHVNFFSIGTNDLVQYTLAVDRSNDLVSYLYESTHPAVLKLIAETVNVGHNSGITVAVCGEMAADPLMTQLLLGLGVDEMSMAPAAVPVIKYAVRSSTIAEARSLAQKALQCRSGEEVIGLCRTALAEVAPELMELAQGTGKGKELK